MISFVDRRLIMGQLLAPYLNQVLMISPYKMLVPGKVPDPYSLKISRHVSVIIFVREIFGANKVRDNQKNARNKVLILNDQGPKLIDNFII